MIQSRAYRSFPSAPIELILRKYAGGTGSLVGNGKRCGVWNSYNGIANDDGVFDFGIAGLFISEPAAIVFYSCHYCGIFKPGIVLRPESIRKILRRAVVFQRLVGAIIGFSVDALP